MQETVQFKSLVQTSYLLRKGTENNRIVILNHGFQSTNERMWMRFSERVPKEYTLLAPNGPYPLPSREGDEWKVGYSWYFYDNVKDIYFVDYSICKDFMNNLISKLGFMDMKKTIIGFSQGGYASIHMAESLPGVDHVIGIGCQFKIKEPRFPENFVVDALHGAADDVVDCDLAEKLFCGLPKKSQGVFESFPGVGHKPSKEMLDRAKDLLINRVNS